jgi:hypothetical protein
MLGYVYRLAHRMQRMGWKLDDPMSRRGTRTRRCARCIFIAFLAVVP